MTADRPPVSGEPHRPVRIAGDGGPDTDVWTCSCGLTRPVTGSYGCADCGDGRPDSWDRIAADRPPVSGEPPEGWFDPATGDGYAPDQSDEIEERKRALESYLSPDFTRSHPPVSGEPSTDHGKRILREWLVLRRDHPPNTALIRDWIVKAEAEARATPPSLDMERLAEAMVIAFRSVALRHWDWLRGDGWPAYNEGPKPEVTQVVVVNEVAEAIAAEYARRSEPPA